MYVSPSDDFWISCLVEYISCRGFQYYRDVSPTSLVLLFDESIRLFVAFAFDCCSLGFAINFEIILRFYCHQKSCSSSNGSCAHSRIESNESIDFHHETNNSSLFRKKS